MDIENIKKQVVETLAAEMGCPINLVFDHFCTAKTAVQINAKLKTAKVSLRKKLAEMEAEQALLRFIASSPAPTPLTPFTAEELNAFEASIPH